MRDEKNCFAGLWYFHNQNAVILCHYSWLVFFRTLWRTAKILLVKKYFAKQYA